MTRFTLTLLAFCLLASAQPAEGTGTPAVPTPPRDSVDLVPLFRPKVVIHQEVIIPKDPFLGGALSLVLPGTGQAYCGKWLKGAGFLAGTLLCYGMSASFRDNEELEESARNLGSGLFALAGVALHTWSVVDGVSTANAHNRRLLGPP